MDPKLRLNVLGPFEILGSGGEPVELGNKKARALLGYLAVESGRAHPRERLAGMLWGATGDERARHNLRQSLSAIRRCCGSIIDSQGDLLRLNRERCDADVVEFQRLARTDSAENLSRCADLYRGDLLEDLDPREPVYDEWLQHARARLRKVACRTVDDLVGVLTREGRDEEAITAIERRLAMDPSCEPAHRSMMQLLARVGRRSEALRQYRTCVEILERDLGAGPEAATRELFASLQRSEPETRPSAPDPEPQAMIPAPETAQPRLAVLPFDNLAGKDDAYFVDGIVEDITTALSCFHSLVVVARGAAFAYRGREVPERRIAEALDVQFLVRGSVRRAGRRIRVNIQLLDAFAGLQLWGHRFDFELEDVFLVQDEITSTVVATLAGKVEAARMSHARGAPTRSLDAYDLYLRGKDHHHRHTADDCRACIDLFNQAVERDPDFAVGYAWLACGLGQAMHFELDDRDELLSRAQTAAERGLELDQNESECHRVLAQVFLIRGELNRSLWHQERALFLNPNDDRSVCAMGEILIFIGRHEEAEGWVRKSMRLNPYHPPRYWTHLARALFHLDRFAEALGALDRIPRPRNDDLVYRVAASARGGDASNLEQHAAALRKAIPAFEPTAFAASMPYERRQDRDKLVDALVAGLGG